MTRSFLLAAALMLGCGPALAQRTLSFDAPAVPASGSLAITASQGLQGQSFARIDAASGGALRRAAEAAGFTGRKGSRLDLPGFGGYDRLLVIGTGTGTADAGTMRDVGGSVAQQFARSKTPRVDLVWDGSEPGAASQLAFGAQLGQYRFDRYRTGGEDAAPASTGELVIRSAAGNGAGSDFSSHWQPTANAVAFARDLVTEPANTIYPESFVERVREQARGLPVTIEVLDVPAMQRLGMGSILAVGQGSARPPRMLVIRYNGGRSGDAPVAFVGKGITFDTGGISIKPSSNMWRMKYDMTGAAVASATVLGLAARRAPVNAVAVAALAENMPSGTAGRPGDVITTASGKTYEVMSTDAEGRMVLVDALWYVQRQDKPRAIIDIATLTGSIVTALGPDFAGLFTRDDTLATQLERAGRQSGEQVWRMPLLDSYGPRLASPIADMRNGGGGPGSGTAAWFIGEWVDRATPWAHLDIAGMAWVESGGSATVPAGATAYGVRLLDQWVRDNHEGR
ncbi:MAG: leucyl aminopeptidase [Pseudoxanthomonas suwonensis]|nr:leucyl aminopeptidase [Pseudoxanthomonas suwonensis]